MNAGFSQDKLAEEASLDRTYLSGIERGFRNPGIKVVICRDWELRSRPNVTTKDELHLGVSMPLKEFALADWMMSRIEYLQEIGFKTI